VVAQLVNEPPQVPQVGVAFRAVAEERQQAGIAGSDLGLAEQGFVRVRRLLFAVGGRYPAHQEHACAEQTPLAPWHGSVLLRQAPLIAEGGLAAPPPPPSELTVWASSPSNAVRPSHRSVGCASWSCGSSAAARIRTTSSISLVFRRLSSARARACGG